jgi:hypothetical protein
VPLGFVQGAEYKYLKQLYDAGTSYDEQRAIIETDLNNRLQQVNSGVSSFDTQFPQSYLDKLKKSGITITKPQDSNLQNLVPRLDRENKLTIPSVPEVNILGFASASSNQPQSLNLTGGLNKNVIVYNNGTNRNSGGVIGSLWSGISNIFGSNSDREKNFQIITGQEIYNPELNAFSSVSATGSSGTANLRPPTIQEQYKIDLANYKGSYSQLPPIKFLAGGYDWQKKLESMKEKPVTILGQTFAPSNITPDQYSNSISQNSLKDIYNTGNLPAVITKLAYTGGEKYLGALNKAKTSTFGGSSLSNSQIQQGGQILGQAGLFTLFSPAISTATTGTTEVSLDEAGSELIYDNIKQKWVRINKLTGQVTEVNQPKITSSELISNIKQDLVSKNAGQEQADYLAKLYGKFFKDQPNGKDNFKKLLTNLYESGEFKGFPVEYLNKAPTTSNKILYEISMQVPRLRNVQGIMTGSTISQSPFTQIGTNMQTNNFNSLNLNQGSNQNLNQKNKFSVLSNAWQESNNAQKSAVISLLGLETNQKTQQGQSQVNKLKESQGSALKSFQSMKVDQALKTEQRTQQKTEQKTQQRTEQKTQQTSKGKFRFFPRMDTQSRKRIIPERFIEMFKIFKRRKGQFSEIGTATSEEKAFRDLKRSLSSDLSASGYVSKGGSPIKASGGIDSQFRVGKRDMNLLVQRKGGREGGAGRLFSFGERREIQSEKKRKQKKVKWI